ncbi:UDP-N-acetylglucosamine transferase subunit ALG14 homolog [Ipomoea triloba]|uniref:UDP-N-acetylglucosamine transferase subunit ALG14 homolog n=1 Tax=Ipomoea triloba TaxID=35885 RepID=UPI00125CF6B5|nr:UDP-N-acetylglucosamine transferase subunit ALG14 homolog [Ipomoea triloba]XP_031126524.1 UDP-N-acetylglucosamine transferase subunit ALG14 homolog [Ipomoea triloba]
MEKGSGRCIYDAVSSNSAILLFVGVVTIVIIRVLFVMYRSTKPLRPESPRPLCTLIVLGSGGHTAEMMNLLFALEEDRFKPRFYIAATTDNMSLQKARVFEDSLVQKAGTEVVGTAQFMQIYRSREVGQSYITSVATTLIAIAHGLWLMIKIRPEVILCNGPGTCIPICVIAFFLKVLGIRWSSIFYVESIARVKRLSLSGLLLYKLHMIDQLFVQWPQLKSKYPRVHYVGRLM